ncbi:MAG: hypothetical protein CSA95_04505 [Bacteroidetes bacterium]|nr:MAG: hypothetical protein CSA95_04505 [Bacteroidota bacterium]
MKKIAFFILMLVAGSTLLFTGCKDPKPTEVKPTISFAVGDEYVSSDVTVPAGSEIRIGLNAEANANSGAKLTNLKMVRHFVNLNNNQTIEWDSSFSVNNYSIDFLITTYQEEGTDTFVFTITDEKGEKAEVTLDVTTEITYGPLNKWEDKKLGDQNNTIGSSFASLDGTVYSLEQAKENSEKIDFVYFYGATNKATLCAPSDEAAAQVYNNPNNGVATWGTRNATLFKATEVTAEQFDAIPDDNDTQVIAFATGADQPKINKLDDEGAPVVLGFETVSGKKGLIKIQEIVQGNSIGTAGHIMITVKVQQ